MCLSLILVVALVSCERNNNNDSKDTTDTKKSEGTMTNTATDTMKNDGMITDTGSDTNIVDNVESMIDGIGSDIAGTN